MDASRTRDGSSCPIRLIGDLEDPWVAAIAQALAAGRRVHRVRCAGPLPDAPFAGLPFPRAVLIHRHHLGSADVERIGAWRAVAADPSPELILAISPYVRYEELERCSGLVDLVVSEAVASDTLPGRLARRLDGYTRHQPPPGGDRCRIEVAGGNGELSRVLVGACMRAGYAAATVDEWEMFGEPAFKGRSPGPVGNERVLTIWEVPVLEPGWCRDLERRAHRTGPVIALAGFADRSTVTRAREAGAAACLELPCDLDDLIDVVDRIVVGTPADSWPSPARAEPPHRLPPPRRNPRRHRNLVAPSRWPDAAPPSTIPLGRDAE